MPDYISASEDCDTTLSSQELSQPREKLDKIWSTSSLPSRNISQLPIKGIPLLSKEVEMSVECIKLKFPYLLLV